MARPIAFVPSPRDGTGSGENLSRAADEHAAAIQSSLELLQLLHDRGVLNLLRGVVGAGDQLAEMAAGGVSTPEAIRAIQNFILLTKFFGSIPPDVLNSLVQTVKAGAEKERDREAPSLFQLLRRLGSRDGRYALGVALDLVEAVGKGL